MKTSSMKLAITFISLMLLYAFSGCTDLFLGTFEPAGEKDPVTIPKSTHTILILEISLGVGSIK